jgi:hypothetical protein
MSNLQNDKKKIENFEVSKYKNFKIHIESHIPHFLTHENFAQKILSPPK